MTLEKQYDKYHQAPNVTLLGLPETPEVFRQASGLACIAYCSAPSFLCCGLVHPFSQLLHLTCAFATIQTL
jgi:hypothetical protein